MPGYTLIKFMCIKQQIKVYKTQTTAGGVNRMNFFLINSLFILGNVEENSWLWPICGHSWSHFEHLNHMRVWSNPIKPLKCQDNYKFWLDNFLCKQQDTNFDMMTKAQMLHNMWHQMAREESLSRITRTASQVAGWITRRKNYWVRV